MQATLAERDCSASNATVGSIETKGSDAQVLLGVLERVVNETETMRGELQRTLAEAATRFAEQAQDAGPQLLAFRQECDARSQDVADLWQSFAGLQKELSSLEDNARQPISKGRNDWWFDAMDKQCVELWRAVRELQILQMEHADPSQREVPSLLPQSPPSSCLLSQSRVASEEEECVPVTHSSMDAVDASTTNVAKVATQTIPNIPSSCCGQATIEGSVRGTTARTRNTDVDAALVAATAMTHSTESPKTWAQAFGFAREFLDILCTTEGESAAWAAAWADGFVQKEAASLSERPRTDQPRMNDRSRTCLGTCTTAEPSHFGELRAELATRCQQQNERHSPRNCQRGGSCSVQPARPLRTSGASVAPIRRIASVSDLRSVPQRAAVVHAVALRPIPPAIRRAASAPRIAW